MATETSDDGPSSGTPVREIFEAYRAAQKAINQFDYARQWAASQGYDPDEVDHVSEKHVQMHTATMNLWRRVRGLVQREYPEYWQESILYLEPDTAESVQEAERYIVGLESLAGFQGAVRQYEHEVDSRHGPSRTERTAEPILLPPMACRRTVLTVGELLVEAGWLAPEDDRDEIYILDETEPDPAATGVDD